MGTRVYMFKTNRYNYEGSYLSQAIRGGLRIENHATTFLLVRFWCFWMFWKVESMTVILKQLSIKNIEN